jgi:CRISPR type III-A-associated RAMP protein Csm5
MIKNIHAETISPVHIGSGEELNKDIEFITDSNQMLGVIDDRKVLGIIGEEHINQWVNLIEQKKSLKTLLEKRQRDFKLQDVSKREMRYFCDNMVNVKTLKEQLHNSFGHPLIPGSSLKGAIRTALFNKLIKNKSNLTERELTNFKRKYSASNMEKSIFGKDPNHDIMRFLQIGDLHFRKNGLIATYMASMNTLRNKIELNKTIGQLTECIATDESSNFRLKIDDSRQISGFNMPGVDFSKLPKTIPSLFQIINQHTINLLSYEIDFWDEDKENKHVHSYLEKLTDIRNIAKNTTEKECVVRVGHGSGWTFMTGNWVKDEKLVSNNIYEQIVSQTRYKNHNYKDYFFPKTRKMDEDHDILGFLKLSILD